MEDNEVGPPTSHHIPKFNSKWIIDDIKAKKNYKTLKENIGVNLYDLELRSDFLGTAPKA